MARPRVNVKVVWEGDTAKRVVREAAYQGMIAGAKTILVQARENAPLRTGTLRRSGAITVNGLPDMKGVFEAAGGGVRYSGQEFMQKLLPKEPPAGNFEVYISFNTPYAGLVHEGMHRSYRVGGPKYLEKAFNSNKRLISQQVQRYIKVAMQGVRVRREG